MTTTELLANAVSDQDSFGSHLKYHLLRIHSKPEQVKGLLEIFQRQRCSDRTIYHLIQGAGLVREETHNCIVPRNHLYEEYLRPRLQA